MAFTRVRVATIKRAWGGETGEGIYIAHRSPMVNLVAGTPVATATTVKIGEFGSMGEAQRAVGASWGKPLRWERNDLKGDIESYDGYLGYQY